ncbi:hypothetical protein HDE_06758 [Halotydeus destructor]|nr:hypothetical protein HDE_06758 [Halotydeus destructor]
MNHMLSLFGIGMYNQSKLRKWFNCIMLVTQMAAMSLTFITCAIYLLRSFAYGLLRISSLLVLNVICGMAIKRNHTLLSRTLAHGHRYLSVSQECKLGNFGRIAIVTMVADFVVRAILVICVEIVTNTKLSAYGLFYAINAYDYSNTVYNCMLITYIFLCATYGEIMMAHIRTLSLVSKPLEQLEINLVAITSLISEFDVKLSVIPLTWFSHGFASSLSGFFEYDNLARYSQHVMFKAIIVYDVLIKVFGVLWVIMAVENYNRRLYNAYLAQYDVIVRNEGLTDRAKYLQSKEKKYRLKLTACGMFDLNMRCILSYLSSLVIFTVLFLQLNKAL